jgi:citronellol/citronellal dehydrogenase
MTSEIFASDALAGRVALVTGGGTNLGRAAAAELRRSGANVVIAGRRREVLEIAAGELGESCSWVSGDIRQPREAARMIDTTLDRHGRLDLLLNNAGGQYFVPAEGIALKGWSAVHRLNVAGTLRMCQLAYERSMRQRGGTIVNVTVSPHHGFPAMAHSGAARAAIEAAGRQLAARWAGDGVAVVGLALGRLATESLRKYPAELWQRAAATVPLQRLGEMEEYAWLVALLATPLGRALSGSIVTLDGALDNWTGPWPPQDLTRDGEVPTEERAAPTGE